MLAQSYIQLDEKERALNVLQDGYRRTGSDRLNELALELAGEHEPAPDGEPAGQMDAEVIAEPEIAPAAGPSSAEIETGEIPIEEYPATEEDIIPTAAVEEPEPLPADMAGPAPAFLEATHADAPGTLSTPAQPESSVQRALLQSEEPLIASVSEEPESVEEEVIAMEIEIAEIEPEEETGEASETAAATEHPPGDALPSPAGPVAAEPAPVIPIVPAAGASPAEKESLPETPPAADPRNEISSGPETMAEEEPALMEPEPETLHPAGEAPPVEHAAADAGASIEEIPAAPPAETPAPEAPQNETVQEEERAEPEPEEHEPAAIGVAPLEPAEALAVEPAPLIEPEEVPEKETAAAPIAETTPAERAPEEPATEPERTGQPMPEPPAEDAHTEATAEPIEDPEPAAAESAIPEPSPAAPEPVVSQEPPAMPPMPLTPELSPLSIRSRPSGGEERVTAGRRENIVQLGSQQPPPLHTPEPQRPHPPALRTLEGRSGMETDAHRAGAGASQGTIQERPRSLALHMGKNISRLRSSNLRLIPGLEFAPLRHEDQTRKQSIAPLISEPMPMPIADPSFRTQRPLEEKEINLPPLPPLVDAEPAREQLQIGEREPEPAAAPLQAAEPERPEELLVEEPVAEEPVAEEPVAEEPMVGELQLPGWKEILEELGAPAVPEPAYQPEPQEEADPFAGNIFQMVQAVQKSAELTPLEELARRLENARIPVVEEVTEHRPVFTTSIVSETLANILVSQGAFAEALKAFQTLARTKPERFDYFQERIWEMKWRISNPDLSWPPEEDSPESASPTS